MYRQKLQVFDQEVDVGMGTQIMSYQTYTAVDFTISLRPALVKWATKAAPNRLPYVNFFNIFDLPTWAMLAGSMLTVSLLLGLPFLAHGKWQLADAMIILMTPLALLAQEDYPKWYSGDNNYRTISRGRSFRSLSGNITLMVWCLLGSVLMYAFHGNLRATFIKQEPGDQIDNAEELYKSDKKLYLYGPYWYGEYLRTSNNPWYRRVESEAEYFETFYEYVDILDRVSKDETMATVVTEREYENFLFYMHKPPVKLHYSKESINLAGNVAWLVGKRSPWKRFVNDHLLALSKVCRQ